jgi:uncharacterized delta-60 repeat protein
MLRSRLGIPLVLLLTACTFPVSTPDPEAGPSADPSLSSASGALDPGFGMGGVVQTDVQADKDDIAYALALQADGRIVLAGTSGTLALTMTALARYMPDGQPDAAFGSTGTALSSKEVSSSAYGLTLQADGKLVSGGWTSTSGGNTDLLLTRHTANGALDTGFGSGGHAVAGFTTAFGNALAKQADGKILLAGKTTYLWDPNVLVARFNPDGTPDAGWGNGGIAQSDWGTDWDDARAIAVQPDGKIVLAGKTDAHNAVLCRLDAEGQPDPSFGTDGLVKRHLGTGNAIVRIAIQPDGRIVAVGGGRVHRYLVDGSVDTEFGEGGQVSLPDYQLNAVALQPDGRMLVAGKDRRSVVVLRLDASGQRDPGFGVQGERSLVAAVPSGEVFDLALQADGKILLAGKAYEEGDDDFLLIRLLP